MSDSLFKTILPSILSTKKYALEDEREYNAYIINIALATHMDTILYANELNRRPWLGKKLQYDFLYHVIPSRYRKYQAWYKNPKDVGVDLVSRYFEYSKEKARIALKILSKDQLDEIRTKMTVGGISK